MAMGRGILDLVGLAATLVFAIPVGLLGAQMLAGGQAVWGTALLGVAVLMVVVEEYVITLGDIPSLLAEETVERVAEPPEENEE
jgi:hypothetical protein